MSLEEVRRSNRILYRGFCKVRDCHATLNDKWFLILRMTKGGITIAKKQKSLPFYRNDKLFKTNYLLKLSVHRTKLTNFSHNVINFFFGAVFGEREPYRWS